MYSIISAGEQEPMVKRQRDFAHFLYTFSRTFLHSRTDPTLVESAPREVFDFFIAVFLPNVQIPLKNVI